MRRSAPWLIITGLYLLGVTLALYAAGPSDPLTRDEMKSFVYEAIATSGVLVIGVAAGLLAWILARDREINGRRLDQIAQDISDIASGLHASMSRAIEALEAHNNSPFAHGPASEHNHQPLIAKVDKMEAEIERVDLDLDKLKNAMEEFIRFCKSHQCALGQRNPKDSPKPKRSTDSGADYTALRGKE